MFPVITTIGIRCYITLIGVGRDPLDENELPYVCESIGDNVLPTANHHCKARQDRGCASTHCRAVLMAKMNFAMALLAVKATNPPANTASGRDPISNAVTGVYDKGDNKGALVINKTSVSFPMALHFTQPVRRFLGRWWV